MCPKLGKQKDSSINRLKNNMSLFEAQLRYPPEPEHFLFGMTGKTSGEPSDH